MVGSIRRRHFIALAAGAATWPLVARAQQDGRLRRIGLLILAAENDAGSRAQITAFREAIAKLGWIEGRNLQIDLRVCAGDLATMHAYAAELVSLGPDVIVSGGAATTRAVQQQTQTIPIVFTAGPDPALAGFAQNIARPEGNITGFSNSESAIAGKWLQLLKEAVPQVDKVAAIFNPELSLASSKYLTSIDSAARTFGMQTIAKPIRDAVDIVRATDALATERKAGLIVLPPTPGAIRETLPHLAAQSRLPAIYPTREDIVSGGLLAYAPDRVEQYRHAASYVDRLLRGAKVSELPVQFPAKYELLVNAKIAKAMGLAISESFLLRADEVIE